MSNGLMSSLTLHAHEVEDAFMAACKKDAIRDPELRASLSQSICYWHRLDDSGRSRVLKHISSYFPTH